MKRILVPLFLLTVTVLSACGAIAPAVLSLEGTSWQLDSFAGKPALPGTDVTIQFQDGQASGQAGCNGYGGGYEVDGDKISFREVASTLMFCTGPQGVMEQEAEFLGSLQQVERFERTVGQLRLIRADGEALVFVPAP